MLNFQFSHFPSNKPSPMRWMQQTLAKQAPVTEQMSRRSPEVRRKLLYICGVEGILFARGLVQSFLLLKCHFINNVRARSFLFSLCVIEKLFASVTHLDLDYLKLCPNSSNFNCPSSFAAPQKPRCQILSKSI